MDPSHFHSIGKSSPTALRSLVWEGSIPICFTLDPSELPSGSDRGVEAFYVDVSPKNVLHDFTRTDRQNKLDRPMSG